MGLFRYELWAREMPTRHDLIVMDNALVPYPMPLNGFFDAMSPRFRKEVNQLNR